MPRGARIRSKTGIYHVILRGVNKEYIFKGEGDKKKFIDILKQYKEISGYKVYGYCLMDNHIHLLIQEGEEDISTIMKRIGVSYVGWYNNKYERIGPLYQDRYKSEAVEKNPYLLTVLRYIHQNPVKAKMVDRVGDFKWSSYKEYFQEKSFIDKKFILEIFSTKKEEALSRFSTFMNQRNEDECLEIVEKVKVSQEKAKEIVCTYFQKDTIEEIQRMPKDIRDKVIKDIKEKENITTRQLASIVGISQSVISRI